MLQRRSNQFAGAEESQTRGLTRGRVLNRPAPPPGGPVKGYAPPPPPRPQRRPLDRIPAPVIISSYASSIVQGGGEAEQKRIQETIEKYEKLNEISDESVEEAVEDPGDHREVREAERDLRRECGG